LAGLNDAVGKDFLRLSEILHSTAARARSVATLSTEAAKLATSAGGEQDFAALANFLDETEHMERLAEAAQERLGSVLSVLRSSQGALGPLEGIASLLITIGTLSRIESGRILGGAVDVTGIATKITGLAHKVSGNIARIAGETARLVQLVSESILQLKRTASQEHQQACELTNHTRAVLQSLQSRATASREAVVRIDERYTAIQGSVEQMVMSLQAQDIIRQRLEHVQQALRHLVDSPEQDASQSAAIIALQRSQVASTREYMERSVQEVVDSLHAVGKELKELTAQTASAVARAGQDKHSLASDIDDDLHTIAAVLNRREGSVKSIASLVNTVTPSLATITEFVKELRRVEAGIHHTALNARIETLHLGEEGVAMRALAAELQVVMENSRTHIESYREKVTAIQQSVASLQESGVNGAGAVMRSATHSERMMQLRERMTGTNEAITASLQDLLDRVGELQSELQRGITVAGQASGARSSFAEVSRELEDAAARLGYARDAHLDAQDTRKAAELSALYSMRSERDQHNQMFAIGGAGPAPRSVAPADDLGDGIELF
jgi:hypothetical protein